MRLSHLPIGRLALAATASMVIPLAWMPVVAHAAKATEYYVDGNNNVWVGTFFPPPFCNWEGQLSGAVWNTALGHLALTSDTTGSYNTASGISALGHNTTGSFNTASGLQALQANTTGVA